MYLFFYIFREEVDVKFFWFGLFFLIFKYSFIEVDFGNSKNSIVVYYKIECFCYSFGFFLINLICVGGCLNWDLKGGKRDGRCFFFILDNRFFLYFCEV